MKIIVIICGILGAASLSMHARNSDFFVCNQPETKRVFNNDYDECVKLRAILREREERKRQANPRFVP